MSSDHPTHIISFGSYIKSWSVLLLLTILSLAVPFFHLHGFPETFATQMAIALVKGSLLVYYFMHIKYEEVAFKYMGLVALVILVIIFTLTFFDTLIR